MWLIVHCFSVSDLNMAKQAISFDSPQHGFWSFSWRFHIKSLYSAQNLLVYELKCPVKKITFYSNKISYIPTPRLLHHTRKMFFANASNWFLTIQPDNFLQFNKVGTRKGMDEHLKLYNIFVFALIYALICLCTCVKKKKSFIKIPALILYLKL